MKKTLHSDEHGKIEYKTLDVKDGDVVVVKAGISTDAIEALADMLGRTGRPESIIVAVAKMSDIRTLDNSVMSNYGWYKSDRVKVTSRYLEQRIDEERKKDDSLEGLYQGIYYTLTGRYYGDE